MVKKKKKTLYILKIYIMFFFFQIYITLLKYNQMRIPTFFSSKKIEIPDIILF